MPRTPAGGVRRCAWRSTRPGHNSTPPWVGLGAVEGLVCVVCVVFIGCKGWRYCFIYIALVALIVLLFYIHSSCCIRRFIYTAIVAFVVLLNLETCKEKAKADDEAVVCIS